jgi:hypothetical protein
MCLCHHILLVKTLMRSGAGNESLDESEEESS